MIYLDYSANTPVDESVLDIFCETERKLIGNANSRHIAGDAAKNMQDEINKSIADLFHISEDEIIYTSGATESNNLAIRGIAHTMRHVGKHIITTPLEHSSVSAPLTALQEAGYEIDMVKIGTDGRVDMESLRSLLRKDTVLVTVCAVDSELGTIQPVKEIREALKDYPNCLLHIDATQAIGKIDVDFSIVGSKGGGHPVITNFTDHNLSVLEHPNNICSYIDNLVRLNIIEIPFGQRLDDSEKYKALEHHPLVQNPVKGDQSMISYSYKHKLFKLTNFGVQLLQVVCQ